MKVEFWSDFVCYDSYLCRQNFKKALDQFAHREHLLLEFRSFPLTIDQEALLKENKNENPMIDTLAAHRLIPLVEQKGKVWDYVDQLFYSYFVERKRIDQEQSLASIAKCVGLSLSEIEVIFATNKFKRKVELDLEEAHDMGAKAPPFIVINEIYHISSQYSDREYLCLLEEIWLESKGRPGYKACREKARTSYCIGDQCDHEA